MQGGIMETRESKHARKEGRKSWNLCKCRGEEYDISAGRNKPTRKGGCEKQLTLNNMFNVPVIKGVGN